MMDRWIKGTYLMILTNGIPTKEIGIFLSPNESIAVYIAEWLWEDPYLDPRYVRLNEYIQELMRQ